MDLHKTNRMLSEAVENLSGDVALFESQDLMSDYLKGKLSLDNLIKKAGGLEKVATKRELEGFLRNKFMIGWKVDETGIPEGKIVAKVKKLLKRY